MQPNLTTNVFNSIYTVSELQLFYKEIDHIVSSLFSDSSSISDILEKSLSPEKKEVIINYLENEHVDIKNPVLIQESLLKLKKEGDKIPVVNLTLAFEPTQSILKNMSLWFLRRIQKKVVLNITLERTVLGGAFISYDGKYKDYTIQTKLNKYFEKQILVEEPAL